MTVGLLAVWSPLASPLVVEDAALDVLAAQACLVVHGHVLATEAEPVPGHPVRARTRVHVWVWQGFTADQAPLPAAVEVLLPGGTLGDYTTVAPGVPRLAAGDEVVLLLDRIPDGLAPLGYGLGTWIVRTDGTAERQLDGEREPRGSTGAAEPRTAAWRPSLCLGGLLDRLAASW